MSSDDAVTLRQARPEDAPVVAAGNTRARRFYERNGWVDEGLFDHLAQGPDGPIHVPAHRYVKLLAGAG